MSPACVALDRRGNYDNSAPHYLSWPRAAAQTPSGGGDRIIGFRKFIEFLLVADGEEMAVGAPSNAWGDGAAQHCSDSSCQWRRLPRLCREISFEFRTRLPHGLLVYHSVKGRPEGMAPYALYIIVENGQLKILHVFGKKSTSLVVGEALNDDAWHRVRVRIDVHGRQLSAGVDDAQRDSPVAGLRPGANYGVDQELESVVLIGGLSSEERLHGVKYIIESFVGCIKNMVLKTGKDAHILIPIKPLIATKHENVIEGCIDKCKTRDNLCFVGSKCMNHYNSYTCDCFGTKYEGELCDIYAATYLTLRGSSYVSYRVYDWKDRVHSSQNRISLYFKTLYDDSVLFYASGEPGQHYIAVSLLNSTIYVRLKIGENVVNTSIGVYTAANHWHNFTLAHYGNSIDLHYDNEKKTIELQGDNNFLYIDPEIYFGGGPELEKKEGLVSTNNFVGSLKYVFFNDISIIYELKKGNPKVHYIGVLTPEFYETDVEVIPLTFPFLSSYLWWSLKQTSNLSLSFDFKSSENSAVLASSGILSGANQTNSYWEIRRSNEEIFFGIVPNTSISNIAEVSVKFDGDPGWHADPRRLVHSKHAVKEVSLDNCQYIDACKRPNTCEHGGKCSVQDDQVVCNCKDTDYIGKNCHFATYRKTCEELALLGYTKPDIYLIDIDGNGPFKPAHVKCEFQSLEESTKTIVEHNLPSQMDIRQPDYEDFSVKIDYREFTAEMLQELISHSLHCSQFIKYECKDAPLELHSATWFTSSHKNDIVDYIGNVKRGACPCSLNRTCANPSQSCNCDGSHGKWLVDEGLFTSPDSLGITEMVFLQQKELKPEAKGRITLGPLECVEANTQKYVVTFTSSQSYIEVPGWRKGDISFSFRTTGEQAILLYQPPIRERHPSFMVALTSDFELTFNFTLNTGQPRDLKVRSKRQLNNGEWQKIWIDYNEYHVRFMINTDYEMIDLSPEEKFGPFEGSMFIGGATEDLLKESSVRQGLIGCFRGLVVNGEILDIYSYMSVHLSEIIKDCKPSCDPNPCVNGATCKELWSNFQCICENPWAHEGIYCETNINTNGLTFLTEESYLKKNDLTQRNESSKALSNILTENILINLRTFKPDALIFYANDHLNNFVHLFIKDGRTVVLLCNSGDVIVKLSVDYEGLDNGSSIQIAVVRKKDEIILDVNGKNTSVPYGNLLLTEYSYKPWNNSELEVLGPHRPPAPPTTYFQFLLGGFSSDSLLMYSNGPTLPGYVGCIRGLKIGNQTLDLPSLITDKKGSGIKEGCNMTCDSSPCKNDGICVEDFENEKSICVCERTSYYGDTCTEEQGAAFGGTSIIQRKFALEGPFEEVKVQLAFSSNINKDKRPLLLLLTDFKNNYHLLIALANNGMELIFEEERDGTRHRAIVEKKFLDGNRHSIYYHRLKDTAELWIDRERKAAPPKKVKVQIDEGYNVSAETNEVNIGGLNTSNPQFAEYSGFTGCISNVLVSVNKILFKPLEEYFKIGEAKAEGVNVFNQNGIKTAECAAFLDIPEIIDGLPINESLGREKSWKSMRPERIPYKSLYSDSSIDKGGSSTIIFLVLACIFIVIVVCALCEVYRTHRKHKRRMEREAEAAIMWPKSQQPPTLTPSIKLQGFKPITPQEKPKPQFNGKTQEQELEWDPMPENTELILDKSLEDLPNSKEEENDVPKKPEHAQNQQGPVSKLGQFPLAHIPEDETPKRDSITTHLKSNAVKPTAHTPGASLSPVFLNEEQRTYGNPISYLGGPHFDSKNVPRASMESVLSLD
ncbi:Neurexin-4 [Gryllus bimaculatus]|nr:Neurexin-4 [Gryllus bimaculatus]